MATGLGLSDTYSGCSKPVRTSPAHANNTPLSLSVRHGPVVRLYLWRAGLCADEPTHDIRWIRRAKSLERRDCDAAANQHHAFRSVDSAEGGDAIFSGGHSAKR